MSSHTLNTIQCEMSQQFFSIPILQPLHIFLPVLLLGKLCPEKRRKKRGNLNLSNCLEKSLIITLSYSIWAAAHVRCCNLLFCWFLAAKRKKKWHRRTSIKTLLSELWLLCRPLHSFLVWRTDTLIEFCCSDFAAQLNERLSDKDPITRTLRCVCGGEVNGCVREGRSISPAATPLHPCQTGVSIPVSWNQN